MTGSYKYSYLLLAAILFLSGNGKAEYSSSETELVNSGLRIKINKNLQSILLFNDIPGAVSDKFISLSVNGKEAQLTDVSIAEAKGAPGKNQLDFICRPADKSTELFLSIISDPQFPNTFIIEGRLKNNSGKKAAVDRITFLSFELDAKQFGADSSYMFWTFQGGTYESRRDWIFPLTKNFYSENYMGMNAADYGGGMPVVDFWTKNGGVAFCSISENQELISLPVKVTEDNKVIFSITDTTRKILLPGEEFSISPAAIIAHKGDFYNALQSYSAIINKRWFSPPSKEQQALEPEWCAWGYERNFSKEQIKVTVPLAQELGFKWATIDDGWQNADGDWGLDKKKFPGSQDDFKELVNLIHEKKMKARLWWVPLSVSDSAYNAAHYPERMNERTMRMQSRLALEHPDWFILDKKGNRVQISWWNSFYLCPAVPEVREYYKKFTEKVFTQWDFDGFKIDGQNFNAVPPCYNPAHNHRSPYESVYAVKDYFRVIYETAKSIKPDAVIQLCPCGTNFSSYNIPYTNQFVASDPVSSWQVRLRAKTYRAITGSKIAYSGDHVELTNRKWNEKTGKFEVAGPEDFASTVGVGGVIASKFTFPGLVQADSSFMLTPEKKEIWKKWMNIYKKEKLSDGEYINLYDIGYDNPEVHVIKRGELLYYSFFSKERYTGKAELRGLQPGTYKIVDYVNDKYLGEVNASDPFINVDFNQSLLLRLTKI